MTDRPLVAISEIGDLDLTPTIRALEDAGFDVAQLHLDRDPCVPDRARGAVALIVGFTTIDAAIMDQLPGLRFITTCSVGTDMVDADAARARGIQVNNLAGVSTEEVAVHALTLLLAVERALPEAERVARSGGWIEQFAPTPRRLSTCTLGLFGYGRIGHALASRALGIYGRVIVYDPYTTEVAPGVELVDFETLLARADAVSIHTPLTPETRGRFDREALARMRPGVVIVNTARGAILDERALADALHSGHVAGAGLDVLVGDPPETDDPLLRAPNTILTPHVAFKSDASMRGYTEWPGRNVLRWAERAAKEGSQPS